MRRPSLGNSFQLLMLLLMIMIFWSGNLAPRIRSKSRSRKALGPYGLAGAVLL
jgi:hypothetical protein